MAESKESAPENKIIDGIYTFVPQIALNTYGKRIFSKQFVRLVEAPGKINATNWNMTDEISIPVVQEYISGILPVPAGYVAALYGHTGQEGGKTLVSAPTYVASGKNLGKKNATNIVQQAISDGQSKWNLNARKKGYVISGSDSDAELGTVQADRPKAMALHSLPPQPESGVFDISGTKFFTEGRPMYMSIKYDGNRLSAAGTRRDSSQSEYDIDLWGRPGDTPPNPLGHIRDQLAAFMRVNMSPGINKIILDGEVWAPGLEHQLINGIFSNAIAPSGMLKFMVFDTMIADTPFEARYATLLSWFSKAPELYPDLVLVIESLSGESRVIEKFYRAALAAGHEGIVLRDPKGFYEMGTRKEIRSKAVVKLKPVMDSEFEITGFKSGEGRDAGSIIWILRTAAGKEFSARPAETIEDRQAMYLDVSANFETKYRGKMLRIAYGNLTPDGIPRFPRVIGIREQMN